MKDTDKKLRKIMKTLNKNLKKNGFKVDGTTITISESACMIKVSALTPNSRFS